MSWVMNADCRPIIVGGFYRSGTSLLRRLIDSHSQIHCPPEIKFFRDFRLEFHNDPYAHLRFFTTLRDLPADTEDILETVGRGYVSLRDRIMHRKGKTIWADKDPENALYLQDWQVLLPQGFRYVHVSRHPMDMVCSALEAGFVKTLPSDPSKILELWKCCCHAAHEFQSISPESFYLLRYEDLVANAEVVLEKLFQWLGLEFEPKILNEFSSPERGFGLEDPKSSHNRMIHERSVGRSIREHHIEDIEKMLMDYGDELKWLDYQNMYGLHL